MTKKHASVETRVLVDGGERVVLGGDTHGDTRHVQAALAAAVREGSTKFVVLGDFGYWEHTSDGRQYLDSVDKLSRRFGVVTYFIDGNHDNHPLLWSRYTGPDAARDEVGAALVRDHVRYFERGHRWTWGSTSFVGLGGAPSADKDWRLDLEAGRGYDEYHKKRKPRGAGTLWWPTEEVTPDQAARAKAGGHADVLLTHDAPSWVEVPVEEKRAGGEAHRELLAEVAGAVTPALVAHGHWHVRYSHLVQRPEHAVVVTGLGDNTSALEASLLVLEV